MYREMSRRYVPSSISTKLGKRQSVDGGDIQYIVGKGTAVICASSWQVAKEISLLLVG